MGEQSEFLGLFGEIKNILDQLVKTVTTYQESEDGKREEQYEAESKQ